MKKKKILMAMRMGGENGGPFISHKRIIESQLSEKYDFEPLMIPRTRNLLNPIGLFKLSKDIKRSKPDLVQLAGLQLEGFFPMLACKLAGVKTVLAVHGSTSEALTNTGLKKRINKLLEEYTIRQATVSFGVSDYVSSWPICKLSKKYYGTIYNITNFENRPKTSIRTTMGFSKDDIVVVSTGRIITEKGFDVLWDTIKSLGKNEHLKFVIAGEGNYKEEFQRNIINEGYQNQVYLIGYQSDIASVLNGADIFIICTKHETLCISLLEAANAKLPLIATNVGGIPEIIVDGVNGYLIENLNVMEFAKKLQYLISHSEARKQMGESAFSVVNEKFSKEKILKKLDEVYSYVIDID